MTAYTVRVVRKSTGWRRWWLVCTCGWRWALAGKPVTASAQAECHGVAEDHCWSSPDGTPHASYECGELAS